MVAPSSDTATRSGGVVVVTSERAPLARSMTTKPGLAPPWPYTATRPSREAAAVRAGPGRAMVLSANWWSDVRRRRIWSPSATATSSPPMAATRPGVNEVGTWPW